MGSCPSAASYASAGPNACAEFAAHSAAATHSARSRVPLSVAECSERESDAPRAYLVISTGTSFLRQRAVRAIEDRLQQIAQHRALASLHEHRDRHTRLDIEIGQQLHATRCDLDSH